MALRVLVISGIHRSSALTLPKDALRRPRLTATRRAIFLAIAAIALSWCAKPAVANDKVVFGLNWKAEAESGGFYQAVATGIYARHGLDVTIEQGGPQISHMTLLLAGRVQFNLRGDHAIEFVRQHLPFVAIAAIFQKDPAVLIAHPGMGDNSFPALKGKSIELATDAHSGWWRFLAAKYGYSDGQVRHYTFNMAPFLADKNLIQEGYIGSEPFLIEQQAHFKPVVLPIADAGYLGYANVIATSNKLVAEDPDLVQRFVDASIEGCIPICMTIRLPAAR